MALVQTVSNYVKQTTIKPIFAYQNTHLLKMMNTKTFLQKFAQLGTFISFITMTFVKMDIIIQNSMVNIGLG